MSEPHIDMFAVNFIFVLRHAINHFVFCVFLRVLAACVNSNHKRLTITALSETRPQ